MAAYAQVRTVHTGLAGSPYLSTHNFRAAEDAEPSDLISLVASFWDDLKTVMDSNNTAAVQGIILIYNDATGEVDSEISGIPVTVTATAVGQEEWTAKQGVLGWRTTSFVNGKRLYGRTFVPAVNSGTGEQIPTIGYRTALENAGDNLIEDSGINGTPLVAVRRPHAPTISDPVFRPGSSAVVTSCRASLQWGVLRSRRT